MTNRSAKRRNGIYAKALRVGYRLGLEAAEREARLCAMSWDRTDSITAGVVADQISKLEVSEDEIQQMVEKRNEEKVR